MSYKECKNCVHSDVCTYPCDLKEFKDRSRFVELPCEAEQALKEREENDH